MPTYEYECKNCGHRFEKFQNMSDPALGICPECRGRVQRLFSSGGGVIVKGKGHHGGGHGHPERSGTRCGQAHTCCGRQVPCEEPPCGEGRSGEGRNG